MPNFEHIEHVVTLMLENHSFDQMLGCMKQVYPDLEGVDLERSDVNFARDFPDREHEIAQLHVQERFFDPDPEHEHVNVLRQLDANYGFIVDYLQAYPRAAFSCKTHVMGMYPRGFLRILHTLAANFAICDHWYSSLPGPTWPNRFFVHSGTANGHVKMPNGVFDKNWHCYDQTTLYDRLSERNILWKIYHHGMPQSLVMLHQLKHAQHYRGMVDFFKDAAGPAEKFPQYSFIEPAYHGPEQNDQHPPSDIMQGELLLGSVYNALAANHELWNSTLLIFLYDEHGGFYDHVAPPKAVPPDNKTREYAFNQYGVRVPALLISPWIEKGVIKTEFDHTSLLAFLTEKWQLGNLGDRTKEANHFGAELLKLHSARTDFPARLDLNRIPAPQSTKSKRINEHQKALISFSHFLEQHIGDPIEEIGRRALKILEGPEAQIEVALERFERFFARAHISQG
jgi:phospholipase C